MACNCSGSSRTWVSPVSEVPASALVESFTRKLGGTADPCGPGRAFIAYPAAGAPETFTVADLGGFIEALTAAADRFVTMGPGARLVDVCTG